MGGGKGPINHYVTPVKAGRVIVEVAGKCQFEEASSFIINLQFIHDIDLKMDIKLIFFLK